METIKRKLAGRNRASHTMARGLGWFSIGLGVAELLMPHALARALGMPGCAGVLRVYGVREIATGIGILTSKNPTPWIWGRVAGDALDIATLGTGLAGASERKGSVALALGAVAGVTLADAATGQVLSELDRKRSVSWPDYSSRTGFPKGVQAARGIAARSAKPSREGRPAEAQRAGAASPSTSHLGR